MKNKYNWIKYGIGKTAAVVIAAGLFTTLTAGCGTLVSESNAADKAEEPVKTAQKEESSIQQAENKTAGKEKVELHLADMSVYGIAIFNYADKIGLLDGYFDDLEQYDVNVTLSEWASGPDQNVAFAAGEIDFSSMGNIPAVTGVVNGYGTKILAVNFLYDDSYQLVSRVGAGIETIEDLKGKNVGTYVGTVSHYAIAKYLEYGNLTLNDVNILNVGSEAANSLRNGDIDAAVFGRVVAQQLQDEGTGLITSVESVPIYNYVIGRQEFYEKYPEITTHVLQLINDTWDYALAHRDDYIAFYAEASGTELETVQASYEGEHFPIKHAKDFDEDDWSRFVNFVDWMKAVEYAPADVTPESLVDLSYVKQIPAPKL